VTVIAWSVVKLPEGEIVSHEPPVGVVTLAVAVKEVGVEAVTSIVCVWRPPDELANKVSDDMPPTLSVPGKVETISSPMTFAAVFANQMLPSGPVVMPFRVPGLKDAGVGTEYSAIAPLVVILPT
jgi:hypothetical protein